MKYHLKQVLNGKEECYFKQIYHYDRNIGKSAALARLSAKYDIPVVVPTYTWKTLIERDIPKYIPKYFKWNRPKAIVLNRSKDLRYTNLLVEEGFVDNEIEMVKHMTLKGIVGYRNN